MIMIDTFDHVLLTVWKDIFGAGIHVKKTQEDSRKRFSRSPGSQRELFRVTRKVKEDVQLEYMGTVDEFRKQ